MILALLCLRVLRLFDKYYASLRETGNVTEKGTSQ
jgi:hypothetical protein